MRGGIFGASHAQSAVLDLAEDAGKIGELGQQEEESNRGEHHEGEDLTGAEAGPPAPSLGFLDLALPLDLVADLLQQAVVVGELGTGRSAQGRGLQPSEAGRHRAGAEGLHRRGHRPFRGPTTTGAEGGANSQLHRSAWSRVSEAAISEKPKSISHGWSSVA